MKKSGNGLWALGKQKHVFPAMRYEARWTFGGGGGHPGRECWISNFQAFEACMSLSPRRRLSCFCTDPPPARKCKGIELNVTLTCIAGDAPSIHCVTYWNTLEPPPPPPFRGDGAARDAARDWGCGVCPARCGPWHRWVPRPCRLGKGCQSTCRPLAPNPIGTVVFREGDGTRVQWRPHPHLPTAAMPPDT